MQSIRIFQVALVIFIMAAVQGSFLRLAFVTEVPGLNYMNLMHAHSHIALLGWAFLGLMGLVVEGLKLQTSGAEFKWPLMIQSIAVLGMFLTFPLEGYGPFSGSFSGLAGLGSYYWAYLIGRQLKPNKSIGDLFLFSALVLMVFSTLGVWVLVALVVVGNQGTELYYLSIQFFLHFQFNGWLLFGVLGVFFKWLEKNHGLFNAKYALWFFYFQLAACILTFALALSWATPLPAIFGLNSLGVTIQLASLYMLWRSLRPLSLESIKNQLGWTYYLLVLIGAAFLLKVLIQFAVWVPVVATVAYTIRNFVIGFFHLVFLGIISPTILFFAIEAKWLSKENKTLKWGVILFLLGVILTEAQLFGQGIMFWGNQGFMPAYYETIFMGSVIILIAITMTTISSFKTQQYSKLI